MFLFVCIQKRVLLGMFVINGADTARYVTSMRWVHSIMPRKSGRTNGRVFDSHGLSTETFVPFISWLLLSTQFCHCPLVFMGAADHQITESNYVPAQDTAKFTLCLRALSKCSVNIARCSCSSGSERGALHFKHFLDRKHYLF